FYTRRCAALYHSMNLIIMNKFLLINFLLTFLFWSCKGTDEETANTDSEPLAISDQNLKEGWYEFEKDGKLFKKEILHIADTVFINQVIQYSEKGNIDSLESKFFRLKISDTLKSGVNRGVAQLYTFNKNFESRASSVIIENTYPDGSSVKDTFYGDPKNLEFGIFASKAGPMIV